MQEEGANVETVRKFKQGTLDDHVQPMTPALTYSAEALTLVCLRLITACDLVHHDPYVLSFSQCQDSHYLRLNSLSSGSYFASFVLASVPTTFQIDTKWLIWQ